MCERLRYTARRGRSGVPRIFLRTRRWRRTRAAWDVFCRFIALDLVQRLAGLAGLAPHVLPFVANALALVGLRRADAADLRGHLADELLIDPLNVDPVRPLHLQRDPRRRLHIDRVRVAHGDLDVLAQLLRAVADALQLQRLLEPVLHAVHHVGQQRPGQAVQRPVLRLVAGARHHHLAVLQVQTHVRVKLAAQLALRALHRHRVALHLHLHRGGDLDRLLAYARHALDHLPDVAEQLTAGLLTPGLLPAHHTLRRGEDGDAQSVVDARDLPLLY